jgi:hypothetical protein
MRAATTENADSGFRKAGLCPCTRNSNVFRSHKFIVTQKNSEEAYVEAPKNLNRVPPMIKLILIQLQLSIFLLFLHF